MHCWLLLFTWKWNFETIPWILITLNNDNLSNTTVVLIFPNLCFWRRSLCSNLGGIDPEKLYRATLKFKKKSRTRDSSSLRPGTKGFTRGKWIIGYNFGIDDGTGSKFGTPKELIVLNILKYNYCVYKSRDMSRDHFAKNRKLLPSWWPV